MKLTMISDWEEFDAVMEKDEYILGIWYNNQFISLDDCLRFYTPWTGDAPDAEDENGEKITLAGFYTEGYTGCYIEVEGEQYRLWTETF